METSRPAPLVCPRCESALAPPPPDQPGSWVCAACSGLWLESAAFTRVCTEMTAAAPQDPGVRSPAEPDPRPSLCPVCGALMSRVDVAGGRGVTIDVCRRHGVWLDAGELAALKHAGRTEELIRLEVAQRLAPLLKRDRETPLFANLSVDRGPDPLARHVVAEGVQEFLHLLAHLLRIP
jgi:Zn-finger nucleic acid-binding protein